MADPRRSMSLDLYRSPIRTRRLGGWRRTLDAVLRRLGPSWQVTPIRRAIQVGSLALYLGLFFVVSWPYAMPFSSQALPNRERLPAEAFLWLDPLVGLSTAIAARTWNIALIGMAVVLAAGWVLPRGFCAYVCPLGSLIDLVDFLLKKGLPGRKPRALRAWRNGRFYVLALVLTAAFGGVLLSGFVAAIPVLTRGLLFSAGNVQLGLAKNWGMVPPFTRETWLSLALFAAVFLLGLLSPRFWCRHVCPSGALLSMSGALRGFTRQVDDRCTGCGKCAAACPFGAVQPNLGTGILDCTFCQTCGGVCPADAIHFVPRSAPASGRKPDVLLGRPLTRRAMLGSLAAGAAAGGLTRGTAGMPAHPIRPPGSVPEDLFLDLCIRCEQCLKVCPGPVLQPAGLDQGLEALWTPVAAFSHAGCHQDCNFCAQICPTGAIRPLSLAEKRRFVMGLAVVDPTACLPHRGERDCRLCFEECAAAGYHAIELRPVPLAVGPVPEGAFSAEEIEQMSRILAPFVKADACVGCGLCEYRCHSVWVSRQQQLRRSAVVVRTGVSH